MTPAEAHIWIATYGTAFPWQGFGPAVIAADNAVRLLREHRPGVLAELEAALSCAQPVVSRETAGAKSDERLTEIRAKVRPDANTQVSAGACDSAAMLDEIDWLRADNAELERKHDQTLNAYVGANARLVIVQRNRVNALDRLRDVAEELAAAKRLYPKDDWHEEDGTCLWWAFPIAEPPYVGSPLWDGFPTHVTHWQRILVPTEAG